MFTLTQNFEQSHCLRQTRGGSLAQEFSKILNALKFRFVFPGVTFSLLIGPPNKSPNKWKPTSPSMPFLPMAVCKALFGRPNKTFIDIFAIRLNFFSGLV